MRVTIIAIASLLASVALAQTSTDRSAGGSSATSPPAATSPAVPQTGQGTATGQGAATGQGMTGQMTTGQGAAMVSSADQKFASDATQANLAEIKLAQLGVQKGSTAAVRNLAQTIVDDHQKLGARLQAIATRENMTMPTAPNADQRATYDRLSSLSGSDFDRAFLDELKSDHEQAISLFRNEAQTGTDPQLKSLAQSTLPALQHHDQMVTRQKNQM